MTVSGERRHRRHADQGVHGARPGCLSHSEKSLRVPAP